MAYQYYQSALPGWGQRKVHFGVPPIPNIRPQPHWNGWDYYNAHGINADPSVFFSVMSHVRDHGGRNGYSHEEAKDWHRRVYGGLTDLTRVLPSDVGAAAAYEAYRMWKHHRRSLYEHLSHDTEREREGLIGLATAEASHLWQYTGRPMDNYGLREALESAALTAYSISNRVMDDSRGFGRFFSRLSSRRSSTSSGSVDEDYDRDYRRHRRHSSVGAAPPIIPGRVGSTHSYGTPYTNSIPMPGSTPYSNPIPIPGQGSSYGGGLAGSYHSHSGLPGSYGSSSYQPGLQGYPSSYGNHAGSAYGAQPQYAPSGYAPTQPYTIQGSAYPGGGVALPAVPPGSTIIIHQQPRRRHNSTSTHKRHHSHHRSLSSDPRRVGFI
ncbi:hypothetical protein BXZ70DRAFT_908994 [Cristinia sonorae]|uniref:Uncharacterized protein n=1 Tax=Cristinia sonorae TaxID=1940300 RepID=A0A8K0UJW2_9AGAR|nr:hypothetical protein BXZ70DRAFT_908994 [Cristinia sonorae]